MPNVGSTHLHNWPLASHKCKSFDLRARIFKAVWSKTSMSGMLLMMSVLVGVMLPSHAESRVNLASHGRIGHCALLYSVSSETSLKPASLIKPAASIRTRGDKSPARATEPSAKANEPAAKAAGASATAQGSLQCTGLHLFAVALTLPVQNFPVVLDIRNSSAVPIVLKSAALAFFALEAGHNRREVTSQIYAEADPKNPQNVAPGQAVQLKFQLQLFHDAPTGRIEVKPRIAWFRQALASAVSTDPAAPPATPPTVSQIKLYINGELQAEAILHDAAKATGHSQIGRGLSGGKPCDFVYGAIADARAYPRALSDGEIHTLFLQGPNTHWQFDRSTSSQNAPGNQGTLVGDAGMSDSHNVLSLNGTSAYVDVHKAVLDTSRSYTVSAWVKLSNLSGFQTFVSQDGVDNSGFYLQKLDDNKFALAARTADPINSQVVRAVASTACTVDVLYHLVGEYEVAGASSVPMVAPSKPAHNPVASDPLEWLGTVSAGEPVVLTVTAPATVTPPK